MRLFAEQQGCDDWLTEKRYPRMKVRTVKQLLEHSLQGFDIPES
jgi:hypothetical protein